MTKQEILNLIKEGEGIDIEFKESQGAINKDLYETICAFLNRIGGYIFLGVNNKGKILGIPSQYIDKMKKEIITTVNNPQKINPPVYLSVEDSEIKNKKILVIYIPESSQVHRCNGKIYDRNGDGDLDITNHTDVVSELYMRKQANFSENKVFPYLSINDFNKDVIEKVKKIIQARNPDSPLPDLSNIEMIKSLGFYQRDVLTGKEGFTLGALLLFGKDDVIFSNIAYYKTDAILRRENLDRYDDREIVMTNLIDSFGILMQFIAKHLPDPFYLEDTTRISLRSKIFREVVSNILIHREYLNPYPAKLIIEKTRVITENANKTHGFGHINPKNFTPFPKNPKIARLFREIGRADELGSGVKNIFKYTPIYSKGGTPELIEEDIFKIIIPLVPNKDNQPEKTTQKTVEKDTKKDQLRPVADDYEQLTSEGQKSVPSFNQVENAVTFEKLEAFKHILSQVCPKLVPSVEIMKIMNILFYKKSTILEMMKILGKTNRTRFRKDFLSPMIQEKIIEMEFPEKPKHPKQSYHLTKKGIKIIKKLLETNNNNEEVNND